MSAALPPVALVGPPVCGKGTAVKFFQGLGYQPIDTGALVREELREAGNFEPTRDDMNLHAGTQRRRNGGDHFINKGLARTPAPHLLDGLRSVAEVEAALKLGFKVIAVWASQRRRFEFAQGRALPRDPRTWLEFVVMDRRDRGYVNNGLGDLIYTSDRYTPAVDLVMARAHARIHNDGTPEDLQQALVECWEAIEAGRVGPGLWKPSFGVRRVA